MPWACAPRRRAAQGVAQCNGLRGGSGVGGCCATPRHATLLPPFLFPRPLRPFRPSSLTSRALLPFVRFDATCRACTPYACSVQPAWKQRRGEPRQPRPAGGDGPGSAAAPRKGLTPAARHAPPRPVTHAADANVATLPGRASNSTSTPRRHAHRHGERACTHRHTRRVTDECHRQELPSCPW